MDLSWYHFLKDLDVSCFEERGRMRYALHNLRSGKTYLTNHDNANRLSALKESPLNIEKFDPEELKETIGMVEMIRGSWRSEVTQSKTFNPLFIRWAGLNLLPHNDWLQNIAQKLAVLLYPALAFLFVLVVFLGVSTEWQIAAGAQSALSFEGLAIFAMLAPFLKIPHELGHALVARYYNIPLYNAGIVFVGFFPLPFVDASPADVLASRIERIKVSLAGIFVDLIIAMLACVMWHLVDTDFLKTIFASIFVFSSLNSLLFNGNPFIRLDGYYVFSDFIGHRNLSTHSSQVMKGFRNWISTLGKSGDLPTKADFGYVFYGIGAFVYKVVILVTIVWMVLPRFFGVGVVFAVWGAYAMFFSPLMMQRHSNEGEDIDRSKNIFRIGAAVIVGAILFLPLPIIVSGKASLDTNGTYLVQTEEAGYLVDRAASGELEAGEKLFALDNLILQQDLENNQGQMQALQQLRRSVEQIDPFQTRLADTEIEGVLESQALLQDRISKLSDQTANAGVYIASLEPRLGQYVPQAQNLGYFLPAVASSTLLSDFPQHRLKHLDRREPQITLLFERRVEKVNSFRLIRDAAEENLGLLLEVDQSPIDLNGKALYTKIHLGFQPLYLHIFDWYEALLRSYRKTINSSSIQ